MLIEKLSNGKLVIDRGSVLSLVGGQFTTVAMAWQMLTAHRPELEGMKIVDTFWASRRMKMRRRDNINSILKHKGGEIWSVSPYQSVYEAN